MFRSSVTEYSCCGYQSQRTDAEKALPDYVRNILDMARAGFDIYGHPISREYADGIIRAWLPQT